VLIVPKLLTVVVFFLTLVIAPVVWAKDGIPDNCENFRAKYYQASIFPRYEPQNHRLLLVDWNTGEPIKTLAESLDETHILGWSPECRYLVGVVGAKKVYHIWDTVDVRAVASVERGRKVDWSPDSRFALVQSDNGAFLINLSNAQVFLLTNEFNALSKRNFSHITWNMTGGYVIGNLTTRGQVGYDLSTGLETALPASVEPSGKQYVPGQITIAGTTYECHSSAPYRRTGYPTYEYDWLLLNYRNQEIVLEEEGSAPGKLKLIMVLDHSNQPIVGWRGRWSPDCNYIAASLGTGQHSDTVVWNVLTGKRVGTFPDALALPHPLQWSPTGHRLIIESRKGAYLWNLDTQQQVPLHSGVWTRPGTYPEMGNFIEYQVKWDEKRGQILAIGVGSPNGVSAYDWNTGQLVGFYHVGDHAGPVSYFLSDDGEMMLVSTGRYDEFPQDKDKTAGTAVWNRRTGEGVQLDRTIRWGIFSTDNHYFIGFLKDGYVVWDLTTHSSAPVAEHALPSHAYVDVLDATTIKVSFKANHIQHSERWNIMTGESLGELSSPPAPVSIDTSDSPPSEGVTSQWGYTYYWQKGDGIPENCTVQDERRNLIVRYEARNRRLVLVDWRTGKLVHEVETSLPDTRIYGWSPNCHYFVAQVKDQGTVIWDATTFKRVLSPFHITAEPGSYKYYFAPFIIWSVDDAYAVLQGDEETYLWRSKDAALIPLSAHVPTGYGVYWDYGRGQVIIGGSAFDLNTGVEKPFCQNRGGHNFVILNSGRLYVSVTFNPDGYYDIDGLSVCDLDTLQNVTLDTSSGSIKPAQVALSADGRYLVVALETIRVWDLHHLVPAKNERQPDYQYPGPKARVSSVRFVNASTLETVSASGVQRWDLTTGKFISAR
jgi:hypothetical protein